MAIEASIIIVNYNGERYLSKLFDSIASQTCKNYEVIFVDNASSDNSLKIAEARKDLTIKIMKNSENEGFCIANNQGFELSSGKYIIFLNNDTYLYDTSLEVLVNRAERTPKGAALTCSIMHPDYSGLQEGPAMYDIYGGALGPAKQDFFYGTGACLLVSRNLLEQTGVFDSKLFMYQEDVDLCWRIRLLGYPIEFEPKALCYHLKNSSTIIEDNIKMPVWVFYNAHCKNRIRILIKNYSKINIAKRLPIAVSLILARSCALAISNKKPQYLLSFAKGLLWNLGVLPDTFRKRSFVQCIRKKSDAEIDKFMLRFSVELSYFHSVIKN